MTVFFSKLSKHSVFRKFRRSGAPLYDFAIGFGPVMSFCVILAYLMTLLFRSLLYKGQFSVCHILLIGRVSGEVARLHPPCGALSARVVSTAPAPQIHLKCIYPRPVEVCVCVGGGVPAIAPKRKEISPTRDVAKGGGARGPCPP